MEQRSGRTIDLRFSPAKKAVYLAAGIGSVLFALAGFAALSEAEDLKETAVGLAGVGFFGLGGVMMLRLAMRNPGTITLDAEGIVLDTSFMTGVVAWDNLESTGSKRVLGFRYLGIALRDVKRFVDSRESRPFLRRKDESLILGALKTAYCVRRFTPMDTICGLIGWSKLPDRFTPTSLYEFNRSNFGYELMLQAMWVGDVGAVIAAIERARPEDSSAAAPAWKAQVAHASADKTAMKSCPMCAEEVRAEAKICRFCRYSFETERMAA